MTEEISAREFYNRIKDKSRYKLVNGLFIVKYKGRGIYGYIGDFHKKGGYGATESKSYVFLKPSNQLFNPKKGIATTGLGFWKKLNISFRMQSIKKILS